MDTARSRSGHGPYLRRFAVGIALGLVGLAGCGDDPTASTSAAAPSDSNPATTLRLAIGGEPDDGFDPTLGWGRYGSPLFQSTLLARDENFELTFDLATEYSVSDDGLTWVVSIRDDARFTDGQPVTAADVAYTFNTAAASGGLTDLTMLDRATAVDTHTVELRLVEPRSTFLHRLVSLGIVPEHAHTDGYGLQPIGSGPFELVRWDRGQQLIVERNDDYYGVQPDFDRLVFLFTGEDGTLAAGRAGELDLFSVPAALATTNIDGMHLVEIESIDNRGIMFPYVPDDGDRTDDGKPIGNDVTSDLAIRRAVNLAIDREALVSGVLEGFGSPANGPVDGLPWFEPASIVADGDIDAAIAVLEEAGWQVGDDGLRTRSGTAAAFHLLYPAGDSIRQALALTVADMVRPAGIEIEALGASWEEIDQRLHADAVLFGWGSHDPTEMYNLYHSSTAGLEYWNPGFYANPAVDRSLDLAMGASTEEEATVYWRTAQLDDDGHGLSAAGDAAWAWLVNLDHTYIVSDCLDIGDLRVEPHGHGWPITAGINTWRWVC